MIGLRANRRPSCLVGLCLITLAAYFLHSCSDRRKIIGGAGSGHVSSGRLSHSFAATIAGGRRQKHDEAKTGLIRKRLIAVAAAFVLGQIATFPNPVPWHAGPVKPAFDQPNWVSGLVWTTLFMLMAFVVWRVRSCSFGSPAY